MNKDKLIGDIVRNIFLLDRYTLSKMISSFQDAENLAEFTIKQLQHVKHAIRELVFFCELDSSFEQRVKAWKVQ